MHTTEIPILTTWCNIVRTKSHLRYFPNATIVKSLFSDSKYFRHLYRYRAKASILMVSECNINHEIVFVHAMHYNYICSIVHSTIGNRRIPKEKFDASGLNLRAFEYRLYDINQRYLH